MTDKTNPWGRPITEATATPVQNPWLTRLGKAPTPAAKPTVQNPWIARMKLQTPQPEEPTTTTARFGTETSTPAERPRNPWGREVEQKTTAVTEQKPAPAAQAQTKVVQESDPLAPWSAAQLQRLVPPGGKIEVVRKGAGGKWEPAYGFRSAS